MPDSIQTQPVKIPSQGAQMVGHLLTPYGEIRAAVVLHAATGVPQTRYLKFARWLAESQSAAVLIYDYRDMGRSARGPVKYSKLKLSDWGIDDQSAALDFLCEAYPELPIWVIGHSLGGMFVPWHDQAARVSRVIAIASGPAYLTSHPPSYMVQVLLFWYVLGPSLTWLFGYLPGRLLGLGVDLPAEVYWQWRRWCTSKTFHRVDWGRIIPVPDLERVKADLTLIGMRDDVMIPPATVRKLAAFYPAAKANFVEIVPGTYGLTKIGHINVFSERCKAAWPALVAQRSECG